ncbi:CPCC family cysteine-rich protein [Streptomyces sp. NPDC057740]|uniref:CPCC family cysteine-rich protein n=1 Tax=Streptomyces sp. NPDC057740 TaxID=3346234 RepID=UPI0036C184ED
MVSEESLSSPSNNAAGSLIACPCCVQRTLEGRANFEVGPECGWEDDGQDDGDANIVRGGPNGRLSLRQARLDHLESAAKGCDESMTRGGEGLWMSEARRQMPYVAE